MEPTKEDLLNSIDICIQSLQLSLKSKFVSCQKKKRLKHGLIFMRKWRKLYNTMDNDEDIAEHLEMLLIKLGETTLDTLEEKRET